MWVQPLDWEDPLEEGRVTLSSVLASRLPWTEEPGGLRSTGLQESTDTRLSDRTSTSTVQYFLDHFHFLTALELREKV